MKSPQIVMRTKYSLWFYPFVFALFVYFQDDKCIIGQGKYFRSVHNLFFRQCLYSTDAENI